MGTQPPFPKKGAEPPPQFSAHVYCGQMAGWIKMTLDVYVGLGPSHSSPPPKRGQSPQFSANFYGRQTAGCIKMPLGMEVGLSPGNFVLDWYPAYPPLKGHSSQFSSNVRCGQTTGWTKMALGIKVGLGAEDCVRWGLSYPQNRGHAHQFWPMFIVAIRLDG